MKFSFECKKKAHGFIGLNKKVKIVAVCVIMSVRR